MGIIDDLKNIFNMSESKRRSRLGVGVAKWEGNQPWTIRRMQAEQEEHRKQISRFYEHKNDILASDFLRSHQNTK